MSEYNTIGVIPANPGQIVIRIWVNRYKPLDINAETTVERWPVIAWRIMDGWAEPICTSPPEFETDAEFFLQPDGRLAGLGDHGVYDGIEEAKQACILAAMRRAAMRAKA